MAQARQYTPGFIALIIVLLLLSVFYYHHTIFLPPSHIHAWSQSDRYALALGYLQNGFNLFLPHTFNLATRDGITAVDLPLPEYAIAFIMKLSGSTSPSIFRLFILTINFIGYCFLYKLVIRLTGSVFKALLAVVFLFTIPIITYYQAGFIPSSVAFPLLLIAWYHFFMYKAGADISHFYKAILCLTLAALVRLPFILFFLTLIMQQVWYYYQARTINRKEMIATGTGLVIILTYNIYKKYVELHYGTMFLNSLALSSGIDNAVSLLVQIIKRWHWQFVTKPHLLILLLLFGLSIMSVVKNKRFPAMFRILFMQTAFVLLVGCAYFFIMETQFFDHEYYFIDSLYPSFVLILICSLVCVDIKVPYLKWIFSVVFLLLFFAAADSKKIQDEKYSYHSWDRGEITRLNFEGAGIFLDSLGIPASAKMLVIDAYSTNAPLIEMNRKGYTVLNTTTDNIKKSLTENFNFIVTQDVFFPSDVWYNYPDLQYLLKRKGGNGKISVYQLGSFDSTATLYQLMGINPDAEGYSITSGWHSNGLWNSGSAGYDSTANSFLMSANNEFGPCFSSRLNQNGNNNWLEEVTITTPDTTGVTLALQISKADSTLFYEDFKMSFKKNYRPQRYACLFKLPEKYKAGNELRFFIWNKDRAKMRINEMKVTPY